MYHTNLHFHFTGIGGSGMSGLAEVLLSLGFKVSGSDLHINESCKKLRDRGALIFEGHAGKHLLEDASLLVYSSAVTSNNPEVLEARERGIPVIPRAEVLAELMRLKFGVAVSGSHGKTTTTSMIAAVLENGGLDPTVLIGGQLASLGGGGKLGKGNFLVAETDESDKSFLLLKPSIAVVTNIDNEHLSAYGSLGELTEAFKSFVRAVPFYGLTLFCIDDPQVRLLASCHKGRKRTYGLSPDSEIRAENIQLARGISNCDVWFKDEELFSMRLPILGTHMLVNALAAVGVGIELELSILSIQEGLASFSGVKRRLEVCGECEGVTVMSDYGHHPAEIRATLQAIKGGWGSELGKLHVIFQPHRYTRTRDCFVEFLHAFDVADHLILTNIYPASEIPIPGISGESLFEAIAHSQKVFADSLDEAVSLALANARPSDVVLCLGAGSVGALPEVILNYLRNLNKTGNAPQCMSLVMS